MPSKCSSKILNLGAYSCVGACPLPIASWSTQNWTLNVCISSCRSRMIVTTSIIIAQASMLSSSWMCYLCISISATLIFSSRLSTTYHSLSIQCINAMFSIFLLRVRHISGVWRIWIHNFLIEASDPQLWYQLSWGTFLLSTERGYEPQ